MAEFAQPHNREAEEAVLGAVLITADVFHEVRLYLPAGGDEFYIHRCRFIWEAYERLTQKGSPIDFLLVAEELNKAGQLEEIGGPAYLTGLLNQTPTILHSVAYAGIVHEHYVRRKMLETANSIAEGAYNSGMSLLDFSSQSAAKLNATIRLASGSRMTSIEDAVRETDAEITKRGESDEPVGIPSGLIDLDKINGGGWREECLYLIACRPGSGKTSLLVQAGQYAARYPVKDRSVRKSVVFFELEMSKKQLVRRMISQRSGIDSQLLLTGKIPEDKYEAYYGAIDWLAGLDIHIDDTPSITPEQMRSQCEILSSQGLLDLIIVDYVGLMGTRQNFGDRISEKVNYCCRELKSISREFKVPVLAAHQMNRESERRDSDVKPTLADLMQGGEADPDGIFFIHHELRDKKPTGKCDLVCGKNREGPQYDIPLIWKPAQQRFESAARMQI
jgi:replicative DNA helicase